MIDYEFDPRYWNVIADGSKRATLRNFRLKPRRHARPGEPLACWIWRDGLRLQVKRAECAEVLGVHMELGRDLFAMGPIFQNRSTWLQLDPGGREGLARLTGHPEGWKAAATVYIARRGPGPWTGCMISWRDPEYAGPIPSTQQLRDLRVLSENKAVIPRYGKISTTVGHSLLVLKWAEVTDKSMEYLTRERGAASEVPIRITELGRWILDRFEK